MPVPAPVHVVAYLLVGGVAVASFAAARDLRARLETVEESLAAVKDARPGVGAPAPDGAAPGLAAARGEAELRGRAEALSSELLALRRDHDRLLATVLALPDGAKPEDAGRFVERPGFEDAVRSVVDRYALEHRFRDAVKKATGPLVPKKPQFAELAKALDLDAAQSVRLEQDVRDIQLELFEILQLPRDDGVSPLEDIQQAEQYPEGNPKRAEAFLKLFRLTIPGTHETYIERAIALVGRVKGGTTAYLRDEQRALLDTLDLDWFGIRLPQ